MASKPIMGFGMKNGKHIGYCPICQLPIASFDRTEKNVYTCSGCGKKNRLEKLVQERKIEKLEIETAETFTECIDGTDITDECGGDNNEDDEAGSDDCTG